VPLKLSGWMATKAARLLAAGGMLCISWGPAMDPGGFCSGVSPERHGTAGSFYHLLSALRRSWQALSAVHV